ncbi:MAG TPA: penicillin binding protein PBP4B [Victivallales bacterium]|nr:penicillin binding protein PBP4B [Victivallales bacterium]
MSVEKNKNSGLELTYDTEKYHRKFKAVDKLINSDIDNGFPGAVLLIIKDGKIIKETAYGYKSRYDKTGAELESPEKMTVDTVFDIASNTKMYATVFAIMKLVSDGVLNLDKTVQTYISEYNNSKVTVRHLLNHSAGYGPEIWFFHHNNQYGKEFFSQNRLHTSRLLLGKAPFEYETGCKSIYSDTGFMVLGILIEKLTGLMEDDYLYKNIYRPLGLTKTLFNPLLRGIDVNKIAATSLGNDCNHTLNYPNMRQEVIRGEVQDEKAYYSMGGVAGHAGLFSNAKEIAILEQTVLNGGYYGNLKVFDEEVLKDFMKPSSTDPTFGCGWRRYSKNQPTSFFGKHSSEQAVGHTGFTGTVTLIDPKYKLGIVLLTNKIHSQCEHRQYYEGNDYDVGKYEPVISSIYKRL